MQPRFAGMAIRYVGELKNTAPMYLQPGQLALEVAIGPTGMKHNWWYRCPCGSGGVLSEHIVHSTDPVDITPSILCPAGCHYFIKGGLII